MKHFKPEPFDHEAWASMSTREKYDYSVKKHFEEELYKMGEAIPEVKEWLNSEFKGHDDLTHTILVGLLKKAL
jgi:hypothetical protein